MARACSASAGAVTVFTWVVTSLGGLAGSGGWELACSSRPRGLVPSWRTHHGSLGQKDLLILCSILSVAIGIPGNATPKRLKNLRSGWSAEVAGELVGGDAGQGGLLGGGPPPPPRLPRRRPPRGSPA